MFLETDKSGSHSQKALDLDMPATLPRHILLHRARGIAELEVGEDDLDSDASEEVIFGPSEGTTKHNDRIRSFGDLI